MICDNCGAIIDRSDEYCPNCGMQTSDMHPVKKNRRYKKSRSPSRSPSVDKPLQKRYIKKSKPESYDYSQYVEASEYKSNKGVYQEDNKRKSSAGLMIIFLLIALALGFTVGLIMFTSQLIPSIPGLNI